MCDAPVLEYPVAHSVGERDRAGPPRRTAYETGRDASVPTAARAPTVSNSNTKGTIQYFPEARANLSSSLKSASIEQSVRR